MPDENLYLVEVNNQQVSLAIDEEAIINTIRTILEHESVVRSQISVALVDDQTMHELNRQYLNHDYPTDVLSFVLESQGREYLEGEIIVSTDTAIRSCEEYGWTATQEFFLYIIHGSLHLVGYDDTTDEDRKIMRDREAYFLKHMGFDPPSKHTIASPQPSTETENHQGRGDH